MKKFKTNSLSKARQKFQSLFSRKKKPDLNEQEEVDGFQEVDHTVEFDLQELKRSNYDEEQEIEEELESSRPSLKSKISSKLNKFKSSLGKGTKKSSLMKGLKGPLRSKSSSFNLDKLFQATFSTESRPRIHKLFLILLISGSAYLSGRTISIYLKSAPSDKKSSLRNPLPPENINVIVSDQLDNIRTANLFRAEGEKQKVATVKVDCSKNPNHPKCAPKKKEVELPCETANKSSSLPLKLVSTVVLQDSVKSVASVQVRGKKDLFNIREGEDLEKMAKITSIGTKRLILKNLKTRQCEYIETKDKKEAKSKGSIKVEKNIAKGKKILAKTKINGIKNEGNKFTIKKSIRDEALSNISQIITQARAVQIKNPDGSLSFRLQEIVPGSLYTKLNLQNGDTINSINGKAFSSVNEVLTLFSQIKDKDHYELSVVRDGQEQNLEYNFQ